MDGTLLPNFSQLDQEILVTALSQIKDESLRKSILTDKALEVSIVQMVLKQHNIDPEKDDLSLKNLDPLIGTVINANLSDLVLQLGAAANAELLSLIATTQMDRLDEAGLSRETIRSALKFRHVAFPITSEDIPTKAKLEDEGNKCLWAWVDTLPNDITTLLRLRMPKKILSDGSRRDEEHRVKICVTVLENLDEKLVET